MRILFFIDSMTAGGKERRLTELMKALAQDPTIQFELVVMSKDVHYKEVFELGIKIHYLIRSTKKDLSVFKKFYRICKEFKPSIVHCWDSMTGIYAVPACKWLHIKLVNGMVVDTPVQQNIKNKYWLRAKLIFPFADIVIGNSNAGLKAYGAPANRSVCIYNGMDLNRFNKLKEPRSVRLDLLGEGSENLFVVGMVAAFEDRKDYSTLIRAAIKLVTENDNVRFILVGSGANFLAIKDAVPGSLEKKIILLGKRADVESIVNIFDVGILLTNTGVHGEGISNSVIEYMALGKPVIATRGGGTNEAVSDNDNGYLIDPNNVDQLLDRITLLMNDKILKKKFGEQGVTIAHKKFEIKNMARQYINTYRQLLKEKSR
ncbi:MAG: glycosyltransferase [Ferruginibacter sp.]